MIIIIRHLLFSLFIIDYTLKLPLLSRAKVKSFFLHNRPFPDGKGAKEYGPQFVGYDELDQELTSDPETNNAINEIINLIQGERFYIKLSMPHGNRQREKDQRLLQELKSSGAKTKITAILDLIYSVRCNMFHGNKGFSPVQIQLLNPVTIVLRRIIEILFAKLRDYPN